MLPLFVNYEQFGALGDGVTDDIDAIVACHRFANENKIPVKLTDKKTYYIGGKNVSVIVKTDVDFGEAKFIIDDRCLENRGQNIFVVDYDEPMFTPDIKSLKAMQRNVDFAHEGSVLVRVINDDRKIFIREGLNQNAGVGATDVFVVDKDGNILTDIDWDYEKITRAFAYKINDNIITIKGGVFTTIANQEESKYNYHNRGFFIRRSNVVVDNFTHYVTGEHDHGAPYNGFISVVDAYNVTIKNSTFTPHYIYQTESAVPGQMVSMGSYDLSFGSSVGVTLVNIKQTIDIMDRRYWGLICSNFCKDFYLEGCVVSRFDAHMGVTNATIINSTLGHQCLNLIGHGNFLIEDSEAFGQHLITLRPDYGSTWRGDITIKNCVWRPATTHRMAVIGAWNSGMHDFGYDCYAPKNIVIDGLKICDTAFQDNTDAVPAIFSEYDNAFEKNKPFAYTIPETITIRGIKCESGKDFTIFGNDEQFNGVKVTKK